MEWLMTVGQISKLFNITSESLRHYDRIGLLKPMINKENGYRYYSLKEMEKLDLILDAKYLEIPLSNIKDVMKNESIDKYINLIELQEKTIDEKIDHLLKIKEQAKEKKKILNEMLSFENNYNFEQLKIIKDNNTIIFIPVEYLINNKVIQKNNSLRVLYLEPWMMMYEAKDKNTLIENTKYMAIYESNCSNLIIKDDKKIKRKNYKGNFVQTKYVGTMEEVEKYIKSLIAHFYYNKEDINLDISVNWIWAVYNEKGSINFVEITMPLI